MLGRVLDDSYAPEVRRDLTAFAAARTTSNACYRFVGPFIATIARGLDVKLADIPNLPDLEAVMHANESVGGKQWGKAGESELSPEQHDMLQEQKLGGLEIFGSTGNDLAQSSFIQGHSASRC